MQQASLETELLTELPEPGNLCNKLLPHCRGQLLTLLQQAANLFDPQTPSCLLMVLMQLLLPPPLAAQCGAGQSSWLLMVLPPPADQGCAQQSSWLLLPLPALLPGNRGQLLLHALLP